MTFEASDTPMFGMTSVTGEVLPLRDGLIMKSTQDAPFQMGAVARFYAERPLFKDLTIDETFERLSSNGAVPVHEREIIWCALLDLKMGRQYSSPTGSAE